MNQNIEQDHLEDNSTYICTRCGNLVKNSSRYCMKCGQVNLNHPDNQKFIQETKINQEVKTYVVGEGNFIERSVHQGDNSYIPSQATNTGNIKYCFLFNILLYYIIIIGEFFLSILGKELSISTILTSNISIIWIITSLLFLYSYSFQRLFIKSNQKWWYYFIPIYNIMILSDIAFHKKILGLISFIPIIGEIYLLVLFYNIGKKFQCNGILAVLFFPIILLIIAFSNHHYYEGRLYIDNENSLEKEYRRKKTFLTSILLFFISGIGIYSYVHFADIENISMNVGDYYYVRAAKKIVEKTRKITNEDIASIDCSNVSYGIRGNTYVFYFPDTSKEVYLPLSLSREVISSYVFVTFLDNGNVEYEVSLSDGVKEIKKVKIDDLNSKSVTSFKKSSTFDMNSSNICHFE